MNNIKRNTITAFTRQMATLLSAGIPLIQALDLIYRGHDKVAMQKLIGEIKLTVEKGFMLNQALAKHPKVFNNLFCSLILAAEQSGTLSQVFERLATYREKMDLLLGKIKKALYYPLGVAIFALLLTGFLLVFVVPQFQNMFENFGATLPKMTLIVISLSNNCKNYGAYLIFGLIIFIIFIWVLKRKYNKFNFWCERTFLAMPVMGKILRDAIIARFLRTLAITITAGIPLITALQHTKGTLDNQIFISGILKAKENLLRGQTLYRSLQLTKLFPNIVLQMVKVGEESGTLDKMLLKTAEVFENDVDQAVEILSSLLEPVVMVILGTLVGGLVIAMYLPIFQIGAVT